MMPVAEPAAAPRARQLCLCASHPYSFPASRQRVPFSGATPARQLDARSEWGGGGAFDGPWIACAPLASLASGAFLCLLEGLSALFLGVCRGVQPMRWVCSDPPDRR